MSTDIIRKNSFFKRLEGILNDLSHIYGFKNSYGRNGKVIYGGRDDNKILNNSHRKLDFNSLYAEELLGYRENEISPEEKYEVIDAFKPAISRIKKSFDMMDTKNSVVFSDMKNGQLYSVIKSAVERTMDWYIDSLERNEKTLNYLLKDKGLKHMRKANEKYLHAALPGKSWEEFIKELAAFRENSGKDKTRVSSHKF